MKGKYVGIEVYTDGRAMLIPVRVEKEKIDYSEEELEKIKKLARKKGGRRYKISNSAKGHIKSL